MEHLLYFRYCKTGYFSHILWFNSENTRWLLPSLFIFFYRCKTKAKVTQLKKIQRLKHAFLIQSLCFSPWNITNFLLSIEILSFFKMYPSIQLFIYSTHSFFFPFPLYFPSHLHSYSKDILNIYSVPVTTLNIRNSLWRVYFLYYISIILYMYLLVNN